MIKAIYPCEARFKPKEIEYADAMVLVRTNIVEETLTGSLGSSYSVWRYDEQRFSYSEYIQKLDQEKQDLAERVEVTEEAVLSLILGGV